MNNEYAFVTVWRVEGTCEEVAEVLDDPVGDGQRRGKPEARARSAPRSIEPGSPRRRAWDTIDWNMKKIAIVLTLVLAAGVLAHAQSRLTGTWQGDTPSLGLLTVELKREGTTLTGNFTQDGRTSAIYEGKIDGGTIVFKVVRPGETGLITVAFTGRVTGDRIAFTGRRQNREEDIIPFPFSGAPAVWQFSARRVPDGLAPARAKGAPFPRQLTLFDRQGKVLRLVGEPGQYARPAFSPDGTRLMVRKGTHIWVFDLSTGRSTQFTRDASVYRSAVWSPDGTQIAYTSFREGYTGVYRKASNGTGSEELLYKHMLGVVAVALTDWSPDGRFLSFFVQGDVLYVLPLNGDRKAVELVRDEYSATGARLSPDSRFLGYSSDESGRDEIYVRSFDPSSGQFSGDGGKWKVSDQGGRGPVHWRFDGRELYYLAPDGGVMAVEVSRTPAFRAEPPKLLFRAPDTASMQDGSISRDGQRFVFAVPVQPDRKEVTVPPEILARYTGTYVLPTPSDGVELIDVVVTLEGRQLMMQLGARQQKSPLAAESETSFFNRQPGGDRDIEFVTDDKGAVTHFIQYTGGPGAKATRK